jgi:hypothetical protein
MCYLTAARSVGFYSRILNGACKMNQGNSTCPAFYQCGRLLPLGTWSGAASISLNPPAASREVREMPTFASASPVSRGAAS